MKRPLVLASLALAAGGIGIAYTVFFANPTDNPGLMLPSEIQALFPPGQGWTVLWVPDSKYEPGAIIHLSDELGLRYISHLRECNFPPDVLRPTAGNLPIVTSGRELGFDAQMLATFPAAELGPEGRRLHRVGLSVDSITAEALDHLRLETWRTFYEDEVPEACQRQLQQDHTFIVGEAARVHQAQYSFYDSANAQVRVDQIRLQDVVTLGGGAMGSVNADGQVLIRLPMTVAIRNIVDGPGGFRVLGSGEDGPTKGDSLLARIVRAQVAESRPPEE